MNKILDGLKVVELSTFVAAPTTGRMLADWGADVVKVEPIEGDFFRGYGKGLNVPADNGENPLFDMYNSGKKSLALNLKTKEGMEVLYDLLKGADVFITNNRGRALKKMGIDYDSLKDKYPRLIYAILTGFGDKGPLADAPGFDTVAYWGSSGALVDLSIETDKSYPLNTPAAMGDVSTGTTLFGAIMAALYARELNGKGDKVTVSLYGTAVWFMSFMNVIAQEKYGYKYPKKRYEVNATATPYRTKDNEWIMLTILDHDRYFSSLCEIIGRPELATNPKFIDKTALLNMDNRKELIQILEEAFKEKNAHEWQELLTQKDIVHDKLKHIKEISKSEQAVVNNYMREFTFPNGQKAMLAKPSIQSENLGEIENYRGPYLGEQSISVLESLSYSKAKIEDLISKGIMK